MTGSEAPLTADILRPDEVEGEVLEVWRRWRADDLTLASPFLAPDYARTVGEVHPGARLAVLSRAGRAEAILPFQFPGGLSRRLGHAEPIGGALTDAFGILAAPRFHAEGSEVLKATGLASLLFTHLVPGQRRCGLVAERLTPGLAIDLPEGGAGYWSALRRRRRHVVDEIDRRRRRAEESLGPLSFRLHSANPGPTLERVIELKRAQYRRTAVADPLRPAWTRDLLRRLCILRAGDCAGALSTLEAGGRLLAAHLGLRSGALLHYWFPVQDPAFDRYAPGRLLLAAIIDAAGEHGIGRIERGVGVTAAKRDFANAQLSFGTGLLQAPGWRGGAARIGLAARWRWEAMAHGRGSRTRGGSGEPERERSPPIPLNS